MPEAQFSFLQNARRLLFYFGVIYAIFLCLLTIPLFQTNLLYLHNLRWPLFPNFALPEKYGLAPQRAANINITTSDNVTLGAWFILSDSYYAKAYDSPSSPSLSPSQPLSPASISSALRLFPTILFFHGNAGTRAVSFRVQTYKGFTSRLDSNVLVLDYRGFGDSQGIPSEFGLNLDAHAAWDWAIANGADPSDLILVGQSLGTAVATSLARDLSIEDTRMKGLVLLAPFSSLSVLLETYNVLGFIPVLRPLQHFPFIQKLFLKFLRATFDTQKATLDVKTDIVIVHAEDDFDITVDHSSEIFNKLVEPSLPPSLLSFNNNSSGMVSTSDEQWSEIRKREQERQELRNRLVQTEDIKNVGQISQFKRADRMGKVVFLRTLWGGHNNVARMEGVVDIVGHVLGVKRVL